MACPPFVNPDDGGHGAKRLYPPYDSVTRRDFRIAASTISAARVLGDALPVDMMVSSLVKASTCRCRCDDSRSTSRSARDRFCGVQSCCKYSGTTLSPTTRLARITELTLMARCRIQASIAPVR